MGGSVGLGTSSPGYVQGWGFRAEQDFLITALGLADISNSFGSGGADGFLGSHTVTLWNSSGTALASATIQSGTSSPLGPGTLSPSNYSGGFRYETLVNSVAITAGDSYVISTYFPTYNADPRAYPGTATYNSLITPLGLESLASASHIFPTDHSGYWASQAGPNFLITSVVPLPAALPLFGASLGMLGLLARLRRRREIA
ncbi:MAG: DUF4082 domain-containing protein [Salaquimonas sp.]|nr:DUF4082 domain-containing protein [Salaquimonas sp.]